jgi:hypothetical protein
MDLKNLLNERWEVIADYPNSQFKIGSIYNYGYPVPPPGIDSFDKYPHLFRKLQWWNKRELKDMPEYVKYADNLFSHVRYRGVAGQIQYAGINKENWSPLDFDDVFPATEQEYNQYTQSLDLNK